MDNTALSQRQRWFRSFPDGTIEFLLVTRLLAVFLLLGLAVMRESQRPMVLMTLAIVLMADYAIMIWWSLQTAADLDCLGEQPSGDRPVPAHAASEPSDTLAYAGPASSAAEVKRRLVKAAALACLPAAVVFVGLAPWPAFAISNPVKRDLVIQMLRPAAGIAFIAALIIGHWGLRRTRLGPPLWTGLLLVPFLHWFAMHRLVNCLRRRLDECRRATGETVTEGPAVAVAFADVTWVLALLPWAVLVVLGMSQSPESDWRGFVAPCGAALTAVFAIADVAAMEGLQRQLVATIRRLGAPPRS